MPLTFCHNRVCNCPFNRRVTRNDIENACVIVYIVIINDHYEISLVNFRKPCVCSPRCRCLEDIWKTICNLVRNGVLLVKNGNKAAIAGTAILAPVPLTIFRSNSKFDQKLQCSSLKCTLPTTTKFCTRHDSVTVVTCAKFRCDRLSMFETRALPILIEFRIRSKYR